MNTKTPAELVAALPMRIAGAYIGQRMTTKNKLAHFYRFDDGSEKGYKKRLTYAPIGTRLTVCFDAEGRVFTAGDHAPALLYKVGGPEIPSNLATAPQADVERWVIEDNNAKSVARAQKMEGKLKSVPTMIEERAAPLVDLVRACRTFDEKAALIRTITDELWRQAR